MVSRIALSAVEFNVNTLINSICFRNYTADSIPGVHIAFPEETEWVVEWLDIDDAFDVPEDLSGLPDHSLDPETGVFTVLNPEVAHCKVAFVTFFEVRCYRLIPENALRELTRGKTDLDGKTVGCTTMVLIVPPQRCVDVCVLRSLQGELLVEADLSGQMVSHVSTIASLYVTAPPRFPPPKSRQEVVPAAGSLLFPMAGGAYKCIQGKGGKFTHFFPETFHAIDISCPLGTPLLAVADGRVRELCQENAGGGSGANLLFAHNSLLLELFDGSFVEYVHIQQGSCHLQVGDSVRRGDIVALSGNVGFCPVPHLHIQLYASDEAHAPSLPLLFRGKHGGFECEAGKLYCHDGEAVNVDIT